VQTNQRQIERVQAAQRIQHISGVNMNTKVAFIISAAALFAAPSLAAATPLMPAIDTPSDITLVAGGCGPNAWRGPYGGCRTTPFYGRLPNGYYQERPVASNACPPVTGAAHGAIAATRRITVVCLTAAGSKAVSVRALLIAAA
jgi:hypothetical protein